MNVASFLTDLPFGVPTLYGAASLSSIDMMSSPGNDVASSYWRGGWKYEAGLRQ